MGRGQFTWMQWEDISMSLPGEAEAAAFIRDHFHDHDLKSWVGLFEPILQGDKTHDLRVLDRDYKIGDILLLREYEPVTKVYTGRSCRVKVTFITSAIHTPCVFSPFALHPGMGVLSIKRVD